MTRHHAQQYGMWSTATPGMAREAMKWHEATLVYASSLRAFEFLNVGAQALEFSGLSVHTLQGEFK